ncbi:peroxisome- protein [Dinochytrium kinnereticum]|nr:peroxisome- protein [Dinochytrium kinnereticum]
MLTALQTLVGRLSPLVLPGLHCATYVSTWQDRSTSFAVCAAWCLLCLAPRFCLIYGPHAVILMFMGYFYSEKIKNPKGKPAQVKVPPLPKMVRYITRILGHVHAFLDTLDTFIARLSWKVPNEQESIHLFQAIILSYFIWILLNTMLPIGVIIMLCGLVLIAWHSEFGEIVREIVSSEWEKARGRNPASLNGPSANGAAAVVEVGASSAVAAEPGVAVVANGSTGEAAGEVGTVNFGNFQATVSLNPYNDAARAAKEASPEAIALKKAEKEAKVAAKVAIKAQIQAERAEEIARAAIVASELAAAVASEDAADAAEAAEAADAADAAEHGEVLAPIPEVPPATVELSGEKEAGEEKVEASTIAPPAQPEDAKEAGPESMPTITVDEVEKPSNPKRSSSLSVEQISAPMEKIIADDAASISSNATSNLSSAEATNAAMVASNRLQQKLADLAKKRLREAAAAKSAAAAASQLAAERFAAVKAATPEPRFARGMNGEDEEEDDDDSDMGANSLNLSAVGAQASDPYLSVAAGSSRAILGNSSSDAFVSPPARTSSRVHSELLQQQQRALSPEYLHEPSPTPDPTTVSGIRQRRKEDAERTISPPSVTRPMSTQRPPHVGEYRSYGSLRLSDDEDEDSGTVILHDDNESYISGYSARTGSIPRSVAGSSVSAQWGNRAKKGYSATGATTSSSTLAGGSDPDSMLAGNIGISQLGFMVGQSASGLDPMGGGHTPTPGYGAYVGNGKRSSVFTTNTDEDLDSDDEHDGSVLSQRIRQRRRSLESDMYTLDRHEGYHDPNRSNDHHHVAGGSLPRTHGPSSRIPGGVGMHLPRPLQIPPVYSMDPFATKAEQMKAAAAAGYPSHPSSSHSTGSSTSSTPSPSYFSANVGSGFTIPMSPNDSALGKGSSIMSRSSTRWENRKPLDVVLSFECFENQRWWVGLGWVPNLLPAERTPWTDFTGTRATPKESFELLPFRREQLLSWKTEVPLDLAKRYAWEWDGAWYVDTRGGGQIGEVDEEGWSYADNFWKDWKNRKTLKRVVRHRRWVRHARLFELGAKQSVKFSSESLDEETYDDANEEYMS